MKAVFLACKHVIPQLRDYHMLVRTDNTYFPILLFSYINHHHGGLWLPVSLSFYSSASSSFNKGSSALSSPSFSGSILAGPDLVSRPNVSPWWHLLENPSMERSSLSSAGADMSSQSRDLEALGLAPEEYQYIVSGLSAKVIKTILSARAPSIRMFYALK